MTKVKDREIFLDWLKDAHALEQQSIEMLERQSEGSKQWPELETRLREHLFETREQERLLRERLHSYGARPSTVRSGLAKMMGNLQPAIAGLGEDDVIKYMLSCHAFEAMEIGTYKSLMVACDIWKEVETRKVCAKNLEQEERMARWLDQNLERFTREWVERKTSEREAAK